MTSSISMLCVATFVVCLAWCTLPHTAEANVMVQRIELTTSALSPSSLSPASLPTSDLSSSSNGLVWYCTTGYSCLSTDEKSGVMLARDNYTVWTGDLSVSVRMLNCSSVTSTLRQQLATTIMIDPDTSIISTSQGSCLGNPCNITGWQVSYDADYTFKMLAADGTYITVSIYPCEWGLCGGFDIYANTDFTITSKMFNTAIGPVGVTMYVATVLLDDVTHVVRCIGTHTTCKHTLTTDDDVLSLSPLPDMGAVHVVGPFGDFVATAHNNSHCFFSNFTHFSTNIVVTRAPDTVNVQLDAYGSCWGNPCTIAANIGSLSLTYDSVLDTVHVTNQDTKEEANIPLLVDADVPAQSAGVIKVTSKARLNMFFQALSI